MLKSRQVMLLHIYSKAAALADPEYRALLRTSTGYDSSTDPHFDQSAFERIMAAVEELLDDLVDSGLVPDPIPASRHIIQRRYWRGRSRLARSGRITPRQRHLVLDLWTQLAPEIGFADPGAPAAVQYLCGIVRQGSGAHRLGAISLSESEAAVLIDALRDRLSHLSVNQVNSVNLVNLVRFPSSREVPSCQLN